MEQEKWVRWYYSLTSFIKYWLLEWRSMWSLHIFFKRNNKAASGHSGENHELIFVDYFVPQEWTSLTPEPPGKHDWTLTLLKSNGIRLVLYFLILEIEYDTLNWDFIFF